jgi:hypothetical protein
MHSRGLPRRHGLPAAGEPPFPASKALRIWASRADMNLVRQHCVQCLTEVFTSGHQTPAGDTLCAPCYSALWGPKTTDEFRGMVELHSRRPMPSAMVSAPAR